MVTGETKTLVNYKWLVMATVAIGTFMATLDGSIVNVALPRIAKDYQANLNHVQWVVSVYLLVISGLLLVFGRLSDLLGRKSIYASGFLVFTLGSVFCGLAVNIYMLIGARALQAAGAAMIMANGMAIITSSFPPQDRGQALGLIGTVVALGSMTGPPLGGLLVAAFGWPSIFWVNIPVGLAGFVAARRFLPPDSLNKEKESFDWGGAVLFFLGFSLFLWGLTQGQQLGWTSPLIFVPLIISMAALVFFIWWEKKNPYPLVDLSLFRNRVFLSGNLAGLISFISIFAIFIILPFYMDQVLHYREAKIGLMMMPFPIAMAIFAPLSGWLSDRLGYLLLLTTSGLLLSGIGLMLMSTLDAGSSTTEIVFYMALLGAGMGLFHSPNNSSVMGAVPPLKLSIAGGINALVRNVGMVTGIAFATSLFTIKMAAQLSNTPDPGSFQETEAFIVSMAAVFRWSAFLALVAMVVSTVRGKDLSGLQKVQKK